MKVNKYQLNEVINFIHGMQIVKGIIDEYILHYTQSKVIIKYIIRPYGIKDFVTIDEDKIYTNFEEAKQIVINDLKKNYTKQNIKRNYKEAKKQMLKKYEDEVKKFDENFSKAIDGMQQLNENYYDKLEENYQQQLKEKK